MIFCSIKAFSQCQLEVNQNSCHSDGFMFSVPSIHLYIIYSQLLCYTWRNFELIHYKFYQALDFMSYSNAWCYFERTCDSCTLPLDNVCDVAIQTCILK